MAASNHWQVLLLAFLGFVAPTSSFAADFTPSFTLNPLSAVAQLPEVELSQAASGAQKSKATSSQRKGCPKPSVLSRLTRHKIAPGETVVGLARQYNLIPATLMGLNPALREGKAPIGTQIAIPPYNGILVKATPGQTIRDIAAAYRVRSDVLFEMNGCQLSPKVVFVPGVNWSPATPSQDDRPENFQSTSQQADPVSRYPLPFTVSITSGYGWRVNPITNQVAFHSGVDLEAPLGTPVMAAMSGTVAFAGKQGDYGNLVVINHTEGRQTRYAQLARIAVSPGQTVKQGSTLGVVGATGLADRPHLHFEIRSNSTIGWVAQDPTPYLRATKVVRSNR